MTLTCPCCKRKIEVDEKELLHRYKNRFVPIFCTYECEIRYSSK